MTSWLSSVSSAAALEPTRYAWRGMTSLPVDEAYAMRDLARDLMRCSAAQVLHEHGRGERDALLDGGPAEYVLHRGLQAFALELHLAGFERFSFRHTIRRMLELVPLPAHSRRAYASYLDAPATTMSVETANLLWDAHERFIGEWIGSGTFWDLFLLPKKQAPETKDVDVAMYSGFLASLAEILALVRGVVGDPRRDALSSLLVAPRARGGFLARRSGRRAARVLRDRERLSRPVFHGRGRRRHDGRLQQLVHSEAHLGIGNGAVLSDERAAHRTGAARGAGDAGVAQEFYDRIDHASFGVTGDAKGRRVVSAARELFAREQADYDAPIDIFPRA